MYVSDAKNTGYTTVSNNTRRKHVEEDITLSAEVKSSEQSGVSTYDFTHMTRGKMLETVNQLIKSGQMSLDETSSLVLLMGPKMTASGNFVDASNEPVDFIASLKNSLTYNINAYFYKLCAFRSKFIETGEIYCMGFFNTVSYCFICIFAHHSTLVDLVF